MGKSAKQEDDADSVAAGNSGESQSRKVAQLVLLSHGLGVLLGFGLFYSLHRSQCSSLILAKSFEFNTTIEQLQKRCEVDSTRIQESTKRDATRLAQQRELISNHQECLSSQEAALLRIANCQEQQDSTKATIVNLTKENIATQQRVANLTTALVDEKRRAEKQQGRFQREMEFTKILMQERADEIQRLKTSSDSSGETDPSILQHQHEVMEIKAAVKRRSTSLTKQAFGIDSPYTVSFLLEGADLPSATVEVEIDRLHELPHSVHTFLSLVHAGLYHGTSLQARLDTGDAFVTGGSPTNSILQVRTNLTHQYTEHGWAISRPLAFSERSTRPCTDFSFGFVNHGPEFEIWLPQRDDAFDASYTCFGHVSVGREALAQLDENRATIVDARITSSRGRGDEL